MQTDFGFGIQVDRGFRRSLRDRVRARVFLSFEGPEGPEGMVVQVLGGASSKGSFYNGDEKTAFPAVFYGCF